MGYSNIRDDHLVTTLDCTDCKTCQICGYNYTRIGSTGWVYAAKVPGSIPLCTYWNPTAIDNMLAVCTPSAPKGYYHIRIEGYAPGTSSSSSSSSGGVTALNQWDSADKTKHWAADQDWSKN